MLFAGWWLVWMTLHAWIVNDSGFAWSLAWADSALSNMVLAIFCFALSYTLRYYRPYESRSIYLLLWVLILAFKSTWISKSILAKMYDDNAGYLIFLDQTLVVRFCIGFLTIGCFVLLYWVWHYIRTRQEDDSRRMSMEKLARETELANLRQQLQPHFLFNTLNSISALAGSRPEEARKMIQQLSDFLRGTLKKDERQIVSLAEELQTLQLYLEIEKVRFGHRLSTEVETGEGAPALILPSLLLQPIVENAIKFGLYDTMNDVTIRISAKKDDKFLTVSITNPFDPETAKPRQGTGFGLSSVRRRLYLLYARNDLFTTEANGNVFIATVKIPQA